MSTASIGQLLFAKYMPPAATVLILWDHCLTLDEELAAIWRSFKGQNLTKVIYIMNRYFTEAVMLYTTYVFTGWGGSMANETIHRMLAAVFVGCITGTFALSVMTVLLLLKSRVQLPLSEDVCAVHLRVPKTIAFMMGIMLFFNLFVVFVTLYNALEIPRRSEHEILDSLRRDGTRLYLIRSFFSILMLVWALKANIAARMHLRIETLRFSVTAEPVVIYTGQEG
ncbi:hypothetical protein F5146DRAFT_1193883 [Armillaria mellea]|nr:hypothetical protein F5146DRAFT_1193883 [Armillaria mellea]